MAGVEADSRWEPLAFTTSRDRFVLAVPCPYCGSKDGEPCRAVKDDHPIQRPHRPRVAAWSESHQTGDVLEVIERPADKQPVRCGVPYCEERATRFLRTCWKRWPRSAYAVTWRVCDRHIGAAPVPLSAAADSRQVDDGHCGMYL